MILFIAKRPERRQGEEGIGRLALWQADRRRPQRPGRDRAVRLLRCQRSILDQRQPIPERFTKGLDGLRSSFRVNLMIIGAEIDFECLYISRL